MPTLNRLAKSHPALLFLIPYAFLVLFLGLSDSALQVDEGADTFVSSTILEHGTPRHANELFSTMNYADVYDGLFVYRTWVPYYLQAASLFAFGKTTFAARLPFALCGIISVVLLYFFTLRLTGKKSVAFLAALFLASSVPALLYFRAARYIGLPILLTILLLHSYITIFEKKKWNPWPMTCVSILYFHTMYVAFSGIIAGALIHFYYHRETVLPENRKQVMKVAGISALFTVPWLAVVFPIFAKIPEFYLGASDLIDTTGWRFSKHFAG
ncbi:MAG: glycosyltransferase family 39 protein, partial [Nitrospinae bacterium]|nr:glycosyltransferase family 39 protein [Nitrospinota bacterium]